MSTISNDEVAIRITVDQNQANAAILEMNENLKILVANSEKTSEATKKSESAFTTWNQALELGEKSIKYLIGSYSQLAEVMDRGNDVAEVTANFQKLQESIGGDATQALEGLRIATQGTVSDFDLMVQASKAVRAGIPTDAFIQGADSIVKIAEAAGKDAATALNELTMALSKGGDKALIQYGINVDLEQSYKNFAATIGTTADKLTESEKVLAAQGAVLDALNEKAKGAAEGAGGAGEAFQTIAVSLRNQIDEVYSAIASNEDLEKTFKDLSAAINDVDVTGFVNAISTIISGLAQIVPYATKAAQALAFLADPEFVRQDAIGGAVDTITEKLGSAAGDIARDFQSISVQAIVTQEEIQDLAKKYDVLIKAQKAAGGSSVFLDQAMNELDLVLSEMGRRTLPKINTEIPTLGKESKDAAGGVRELTDEQKKELDLIKQITDIVSNKAVKALNEYGDELQDIVDANPEATFEDMQGSLIDASIAANKAGVELADIQKVLDYLRDHGKVDISVAIKKDDQQLQFENIQKGIEEAIGKGIADAFSNLADVALNGGSFADVFGDIGNSVGSAIGAAAGEGLGEALNGLEEGGIIPAIASGLGSSFGSIFAESVANSISQIGNSTGSSIAGALTALFPMFGTSFFSDDIASFFDSVFGGNQDPAANARESIERLFNEIIDGFQEAGIAMEDFTDFGRDAFDQITDSAGNVTTTVGQMFETLSEDAQIQFQGLGTALEQALQIEGLEEGQLGQLLAANFGMGANSLNDLQLLINQMGISLEEVSAQLENAFLMGDITAGEFLNSLNQIRDLYEQGIPGAIGDTQAALNNFKEDSLSSGAAAQDALGDLAAEFQEYNESIGDTGEKTIQDLLDYLVSTGQITTEEASQMFQAFSAAGIDSLEGLMNASAEQTAVIVNNLESLGYAFQDNVESAQELREELDAIKDKEINIRLNVTSNISDEDRELLNQTNTNIPQGQGV